MSAIRPYLWPAAFANIDSWSEPSGFWLGRALGGSLTSAGEASWLCARTDCGSRDRTVWSYAGAKSAFFWRSCLRAERPCAGQGRLVMSDFGPVSAGVGQIFWPGSLRAVLVFSRSRLPAKSVAAITQSSPFRFPARDYLFRRLRRLVKSFPLFNSGLV